MIRAGVVVTLVLAAACGRRGFDAIADAPGPTGDAQEVVHRIDALSAPDADPSLPDAQVGTGGYNVIDGNAPYTSPDGAQLVPGFADGADEQTYPLALPFTFPFYGIGYDAVTVSVNGWVTFAAAPTGDDAWDNDCSIDTTPPDAMIAVFWDDLFASSMYEPFGSIVYAASGVAPDRRFTVEWRNLDAWYLQGMSYYGQQLRVTQKLVLHEDGTFELHYGPRTVPVWDRDCGLDRHRGCSATVGIEASGGMSSITVQCGTATGPGPGYVPIDEGRLITFVPI